MDRMNTQNYKALPQVLSALAMSSVAALVGGWVSFTSVALPMMIAETESFNKTEGEEENLFVVDIHVGSWIVSTFFLGTFFGCYLGGPLTQIFGCNKTVLFSAPLATLTWVMVAASHRVWVVYLSRFLAGLLYGVYLATAKVYTAEIAHPDLRGSLGALISNFFALGNLFTFILGYFISSWRLIAWILLLPSIIQGVAVFFVPDSPFWLLEKGRDADARESLSKLRGPDYNIEPEFVEMVKKKKAKDPDQKVVSTIFSKVFFLPFIRIGVLSVIAEWAGIVVIDSYMVNIFQDSGTSISPAGAPILVSLIQLLLSLVSTLILRTAPRKPLFLGCGFLMFLGTLTLGVQDLLTDENSISFGWVPVVAVVGFQASRNVGFMAIIHILIAESFPTQIRCNILNKQCSMLYLILFFQIIFFWYCWIHCSSKPIFFH